MIWKKKVSFPHIGMRIIKSSVAVGLCYIISFIRGDRGIVFYSFLSVLWCIQNYSSNTKKNAIQRTTGTLIGVAYGLLFLLLEQTLDRAGLWNVYLNAAAITLMVIVVLYTTVVIKKKNASYFSTVVFLSIAVNHAADANPYLFAWDRFLDTMIGIIVGIGVNAFSLPKEKRKDILFVSNLDETLLNGKEVLTDYSKVELNRLLDEGANFTLTTKRTPASLMEPMRDIRLKLPVIAMDGAVLYDITEKQYLKIYVISPQRSQRLTALMREHGLQCFSSVIIDDLLMIYYEEPEDEVQKELVQKLRRSPYRNYVKRPLPEEETVVYFMLLYPRAIMEAFYEVLREQGFSAELKILLYDAVDYPGYAYIKIYNKNASQEHMIDYLRSILKIEKMVTFGSEPGKYDCPVAAGDGNAVVRKLKNLYEPVKRPFRRKR